ncbi:MAG: tripartite tricarboxylate transporter substrate binding protein [Eubacteriales bacterium]|nr:tripartite tricarboxylate transporter substrate binding protein [Eubacteriales bacterium]
MKRKISLFLVISLIIMILGGCNNTPATPTTQAGGETTQAPKIDYPTKAITIICNYGAGGGTDLATRALAQAMERILGQPITVENKAGGSGTLGIIETMNRANDGYTIGVLTAAPLTIVPHQMEVPFTPEDFDYIGTFGQYGYGIAVKADSPYQSIADIVALAKASSGPLAYSASGYPQPFAMNAIGEKEGIEFTYAPYASASEVLTAVLGGHIQVAVGGQAEITQFMKSGELRLLAAAGESRWETAPEVPTLLELGYDVALRSYMGLGLPSGVDPQIAAILQDAFSKAVEDEQFLQVMRNMNFMISYTTGEEYKEFLARTYVENKELMAE